MPVINFIAILIPSCLIIMSSRGRHFVKARFAVAANCGDLDTSGCAGAASCGNGRVDAEEQCDTGIASGVGACPATSRGESLQG